MNKLRELSIITTAVFLFLTACASTKFSGYSVHEAGSMIYSSKPEFRVEPSTTTPELWKRGFANYEIRLKLDPEFPSATDYVKIEVFVTDTAQKPPVPVKGAKISCNARMPNVPDKIHWLANNICYLTEHSPGVCSMAPIVFGTGGSWDLLVKAEITEGKIFSAVFPLEVKGPPWPGNYIPIPEVMSK
ncbi:MAG: hypothetical protein A3J83_08680 [Elusimicrobia bacterium RIFOXYA2_FULL_40_6]|nr:MAG: hypothetical protein A3J83_08680 [Elusimicrobia bacterium RIFOXYA2_FULL_40_6]